MTTVSAMAPTDSYPWVPWRGVKSYLNDAWDLENCPHHSIVGLTGSGKSFLTANGILDLAANDRVLIIDTKTDDPIISKLGKSVKRLPRNAWYSSLQSKRQEPRDRWFRIPVPDNRVVARDMVGEAIEEAYRQGDWIIVIDEEADITGRDPVLSLKLNGIMAKVRRKGRGRHVGVISSTQTPVDVDRLFYDQASFAWIGRIRDESRQKRLLEIGGMSKKDLTVISELQRRQWLLAADNGEYFARTIVKKGA